MDCLVIGGGSAGLTAAAIYLARFNRSVTVADSGDSRARFIPKTHNYPGFAEGVSGLKLLELLGQQAEAYGVRRMAARVEGLERTNDAFLARWNGGEMAAVAIILATGLIDKCPPISNLDEAVARGLVRYCPICDGFEASGQRIAVLGEASAASSKALFLRTYSNAVTLLTLDGSVPGTKTCDDLDRVGVAHPTAGVAAIEHDDGPLSVTLTDGEKLTFDTLYPVLGCEVRSQLATALGANGNKIGCLTVDHNQQTSVPGLYAIGDVVSDLHQIAVGTGHAAIAATHLHHELPSNPKGPKPASYKL